MFNLTSMKMPIHRQLNSLRLRIFMEKMQVLALDKAVASKAVFAIVSGSDGRTETLLGPAKLKNGKR